MDLNFTAVKEILRREVPVLLFDGHAGHPSDQSLKGAVECIAKLAEENIYMKSGIGMSWVHLLSFIVVGKQVGA